MLFRSVSTHPAFYDPSQPLPRFFVTETVYKVSLPRTIIGSDVWIGQNVLIRAGVTIGIGAVIGAGSVVTKDIEPYSIAVGVPARHVRYRFDEATRVALLSSRWWTWDDLKLQRLAIHFAKPLDFIKAISDSKEMP